MEIQALTIVETAVVKEGLSKLNDNGLGTLFIVNPGFQLLGILTDGDLRRAILKGASLDTPLGEIMNRNFTALPVGTDNDIILKYINDAIRIIPLVDGENKLVDYASIKRLRRISVAAPLLDGNELAYITDCIKTQWISSQGKYVRKFEEVFSGYHKGMSALAVSNGTVAIHLALEALRIGKGDEVIVPDLTFAATINAVLYTGATPVIADVEPGTWNIDIDKAEQLITKNTKAIIPVHLFGQPCDMTAIHRLAEKHNLLVIEDCAEALGSYYKSEPVGVFGDAATFSFYGNKTITTGEGGMVLFKDPAVAERAAMLRDHGMQKDKRYWHAEVGYNYRMTNIQAAIGVAQFERLQEFVAAKQRIAHTYSERLTRSSFFTVPQQVDETINSFWLYTCSVKPEAPFTRDELIDFLNQHGVETRPVFFPLHIMPPYINFAPSLPEVSAQLSKSGISLPSSVSLTEMELLHVCNMIDLFISKVTETT